MNDRDPKTGRFLAGNQAARGNRGNRQSKWGNQNAVRHGLYRRCIESIFVDEDGWLNVIRPGKGGIRLHPSTFYQGDDGWWYVREDVIAEMNAQGW